MWAPSIETQCNVMISSVGRGPSSSIFLHLLNRNWHHIQKHRLVLNLRIEQNPEYFPNTQQLWTLRDFMMVLLPFPYVQFGQFKVCNNKCELKVWKWARMNNSDESGNFLSESFGISLNRTHKHLRQLHYLILDNQTFFRNPNRFHKIMNAFGIPAEGAVSFQAAFHHAIKSCCCCFWKILTFYLPSPSWIWGKLDPFFQSA